MTGKPITEGYVELKSDGLHVVPDDDYYSGVIAPKDAIELARSILAQFGATDGKTE